MRAASAASTAYVRGDATPGNIAKVPQIARPPARAACVAASGVLVAGIAVLAFDSGGYYEDARSIAGVAAWVLFALLAVVLPRERLRLGWEPLIALAGLALLTAWTAIAKSWSPLPDVAADDVERLVAYVGAFGAAVLACTEPVVRRWIGPALALVAVVVVGYGLSERFLPGLLEFEESRAAVGRLAQPLTYWNAMGALAAIGLVLAVRMAADPARRWMRVAAAARDAAARPRRVPLLLACRDRGSGARRDGPVSCSHRSGGR